MGDKLFYTYTGKWSSNVVPTSLLYPDSIIFHKSSKRIIQNGIIYGGGNGGPYYIEGNTSDTVGRWTGTNTDIPENYEGLTVIYIPKVNAGSSSTTLNINGYGAFNCFVNGVNITNKHYKINEPIILTYTGGKWKRSDYAPNDDNFTTRVYNKDGENIAYNIVFTEKSTTNSYTFAYVDANLRFNPYTNTLTVGKIDAVLNSLTTVSTISTISTIDRRTITNIGITADKKIAYYYANSIGASYYKNGSYYGEVFSDYEHNTSLGNFSSAFGHYTVSNNSYEVSFGSYNKANSNQIFSIGIGTSDANRKNAIWLDKNGSSYVSNVIPQENNVYNLGTPTIKFNTIYGGTFNGTRFTGTSDYVKVIVNNTSDSNFIVGFNNSTKMLYYENNLLFTDEGQVEIRTSNSTPPFVITSNKLVSNLNADRLDNYHANGLLESAYIKTDLSNLTYYIKVGGKEISGKQSLYNDRLSGNNTYTAWGQIFWSNGTPKSIEGTISNTYNITPYSTNQYNLGSNSLYWKNSYLTNIYTSYILFDGNKDIGNGLNFVYWQNGKPVITTSSKGNSTKPIYLENGVFKECTNVLSVNIKEGTANRMAYYSKNNEISSAAITSDGNYLGNISYLSINNAHQTNYRLYVNGTSIYKGILNIDSNAIGGANHINFNRASWNYINIPTNGTFAICINGASSANTRLAVDVNSVYPGANNNTIDLGTSSYRWKTGYINNLITKKITFWDGTNNINDIGGNTKFIYWSNGVATVSTATVGNTGRPIYLNGGVFTPCNDAFIPKALVSKGTTATTTAGQVYGVVGNTTSGSRVPTKWYVYLDTGETELKDGMIIEFRLPTAGLGTVGECITIDGNEQHFHQVVYNTNSFLTTHFAINSVITVQYDSTIAASMYGKYDSSTSKYVHNGNTQTSTTGVWRVLSLYDSGNTDVRYQQTIYYPMKTVASDGAIRRYTLCMQTPDGKITSLCLTDNGTGSTTKTMYSGYLDPRKIYYWAHTDNYAANANITRNNTMLTHNGDLIDYRYTFNCGTTLTGRNNFYIVGTIDSNGFKLDPTQPWSYSLPTSEDNKVYIFVGWIYPESTVTSSYRGTLEENNTIYVFKNGAIRIWSEYSEYSNYADRLKTARTITIGATGRSFDGSANIYWTIANIFGTTSIGTTTNPIYYDGSNFVKTTYLLSATVNSGATNRMAYYSGANAINQASSIYATTTTLAINKTSAPANSGNFQVVGTSTMRNIYPEATNTYDLGSTSLRWKTGYINNLITTKVTFYDGTNNVNDVGGNTKFIYWLNGIATASTANIGSSSEPIYLNNGVFTKCITYYDYGLTSFTKSIKVLKTWGDTGISGTDLETGTYIIQMIVGTNIYYSGIVSWYKDATSSTETDEIVLHMAGKNPTERIYLKTTMVSSGNLKLQISGEKDWSAAANIVFKFKKLI